MTQAGKLGSGLTDWEASAESFASGATEDFCRPAEGKVTATSGYWEASSAGAQGTQYLASLR